MEMDEARSGGLFPGCAPDIHVKRPDFLRQWEAPEAHILVRRPTRTHRPELGSPH